MQRTKKKVQQSKPNHFFARQLPSRVAPPGTAPPPGARPPSRPSPLVFALAVRFLTPRGRAHPLWKRVKRAFRNSPLFQAHRRRWRLKTPEGLSPPLTHSLYRGKARPGRRNKAEARLGRRTEVPGRGEEGVGAGSSRRRESILQPC